MWIKESNKKLCAITKLVLPMGFKRVGKGKEPLGQPFDAGFQ